MSKLPLKFNFGTEENFNTKELLNNLEKMYYEIVQEVNQSSAIVTDSAPSGTPDSGGHIPSTVDIDYANGQIWIYQQTTTSGGPPPTVSDPLIDRVYIKTQTLVSGGVRTALWMRLI